MRFETILFNIAIIIFIICLIYLYIYINYKYEGFEINANETIFNSQGSSIEKDLSESTTDNNQLISSLVPEQITIDTLKDTKIDGKSPSGAYPSRTIPFIKLLVNVAKYVCTDSDLRSKTFSDGYYWINFNSSAGPQYIYCIMNEAYYGGGWMLAMRGVKNSRTFKYDSSYWTDNRLLNYSAEHIKSLMAEIYNEPSISYNQINSKDDIMQVSSIGDFIYNNSFTADNAVRYDTKTEAFNSYSAKEWMAIFYYKKNDAKSLGGDTIYASYGGKIGNTSISSENKNTRGWIWYEPNVPNKPNDININRLPISALFASRQSNNKVGLHKGNNFVDLRGGIQTTRLNKWKNHIFGSRLWSSQTPYNFYGINYEIPSGNQPPNVRWGFAWNENGPNDANSNDVYAGIGLQCRGGYSAGDFVDGWNDTTGVNDSIAFEWYVR